VLHTYNPAKDPFALCHYGMTSVRDDTALQQMLHLVLLMLLLLVMLQEMIE
jgi:hypothetical protein